MQCAEPLPNQAMQSRDRDGPHPKGDGFLARCSRARFRRAPGFLSLLVAVVWCVSMFLPPGKASARQTDIAPTRIARIEITGNRHTRDYVIRRELILKPGKVFSLSALQQSVRNVMALGYFTNVELNPPPRSTQEGELILFLRVTERPTGTVAVGGGYSQRDGLDGSISFSTANLRGTGRHLSLAWQYGEVNRGLQFGFTEPWLFSTPTWLDVSLYDATFLWTADFRHSRRGGALEIGRRWNLPNQQVRAGLGYRLEEVDYHDFADAYDPDPAYDLRTTSWPVIASVISLNIGRDSRDPLAFPSVGSVSDLCLQVAGGPLGGGEQFVRWDITHSYSVAPLQGWVTAMHIKGGLIESFGGWGREGFIAFHERYLPGGTSPDGQIRGYDNRRVGPLDSNEREIGARSVLVISLEQYVPIARGRGLYGLLFTDAGNAWLSLEDSDPFDLRRSVGVGVRWVGTPYGTLGLDLAHGFDHFENGRRVGRWKFHLQFGTRFF